MGSLSRSPHAIVGSPEDGRERALATMTSHRSRSDEDRARLIAEFHEMPGLSLTLEQTARLTGMDREQCYVLLTEFVVRGILTLTRDGKYRRAT